MVEKSLARTILEASVEKFPNGLTDEGAREILGGLATVAGMCLARLDPVEFLAFVNLVNDTRTATIGSAKRQMSGKAH